MGVLERSFFFTSLAPVFGTPVEPPSDFPEPPELGITPTPLDTESYSKKSPYNYARHCTTKSLFRVEHLKWNRLNYTLLSHISVASLCLIANAKKGCLNKFI